MVCGRTGEAAAGRPSRAAAPTFGAWTARTGGDRSGRWWPTTSRGSGSPSGCPASRARTSTAARPCSTNDSGPMAGARDTSSAAGSCRRPIAILEYEEAYRRYLCDRPALVRFLVTICGNVYDDRPGNVDEPDDYGQPDSIANHYQDISVRRVIAELVDDPDWPDVVETAAETVDMIDLGTGETRPTPRARGFRGSHVLQIRDPLSPGYVLNPAVVPVHDPSLITTIPDRGEWYHLEGCAHLSVEAFWQMSKVDRGPLRPVPGPRGGSAATARGPVTDRGSDAAAPARSSPAAPPRRAQPRHLPRARPRPAGRRRAQHGLAMAAVGRPVPAPVARRRRPARGLPRVPRPPRDPVRARPRRARPVGIDRHRHPARPPAVHGQLRRGRLGGVPAAARRGGDRSPTPAASTWSSSRARSASSAGWLARA